MSDVPPQTWGFYAYYVWEQNQRKGHQVHNRRAFEESVAVDGLRRLSDQAERWWNLYTIDARRLAAALADGRAPRYVQRREDER